MFQDSIDYNEYQFGERKESVISAWRPLDVKLGSALLRGFQYLIFLSAGVMGVVNGISNAEGTLNADMAAVAGNEAAEEAVKVGFVEKIRNLMESVNKSSLNIIGLWIFIILALCFVAVWVLIHFGYKITEESHRDMVEELEKRHAASGFNPEEVEAK
jgi:Na+/melibiose symporter-like transporter